MKLMLNALEERERNELLSYIAAFALYATENSIREKIENESFLLQSIRGMHITLERSFIMLAAYQKTDDEPSDLLENDIYKFSKKIKETLWYVQRTFRSLAFFSLPFNGNKIHVAVEMGKFSPMSEKIKIERMALISSSFLKEFEDFNVKYPTSYFRAITVYGTGRVGIILPKDKDWRVLPIPDVSINPFPKILFSENFSQEISFQDFIEYEQSDRI